MFQSESRSSFEEDEKMFHKVSLVSISVENKVSLQSGARIEEREKKAWKKACKKAGHKVQHGSLMVSEWQSTMARKIGWESTKVHGSFGKKSP